MIIIIFELILHIRSSGVILRIPRGNRVVIIVLCLINSAHQHKREYRRLVVTVSNYLTCVTLPAPAPRLSLTPPHGLVLVHGIPPMSPKMDDVSRSKDGYADTWLTSYWTATISSSADADLRCSPPQRFPPRWLLPSSRSKINLSTGPSGQYARKAWQPSVRHLWCRYALTGGAPTV